MNIYAKQPDTLVAGAAGKTGSAVITQLRQQDFPVRAIVRFKQLRTWK